MLLYFSNFYHYQKYNFLITNPTRFTLFLHQKIFSVSVQLRKICKHCIFVNIAINLLIINELSVYKPKKQFVTKPFLSKKICKHPYFYLFIFLLFTNSK